jgi:hypothetical protein
MLQHVWVKSGTGKMAEAKKNDLCDAALYAHRVCDHYRGSNKRYEQDKDPITKEEERIEQRIAQESDHDDNREWWE